MRSTASPSRCLNPPATFCVNSMARDDALRAHILELLAPLDVIARSMFGGVGFFKERAMFALIAEGVFYLKTDDSNRPDFERAGSSAFTYDGKGRPIVMPYHAAPDDLFEDADEMRRWAGKSIAIALAAAAAKPKKPPARRTPVVTKERTTPSRSKPVRRR